MKLIIEEKKEQELEVGDVVVLNGTPYLLMKNGEVGLDKFMLREFNGICGAIGNRTLEEMRDYVKKASGARIFKKNEFELILRQK